VPVLTPSSAGADADRRGLFDTALDRTQDADAARRAGLALHAMLQHLPRLPEVVWDQVLERALPQLLPEAPETHAGLAATALSILRRPELAHLFGPDSRAEVPFLVTVRRDGRPVRLAGRIDRLVVTEKNLFVLDYKSDAAIPADPANMPSPYATQLALYALAAGQLFPGREVKAAILWTALESLMELPPAQLAAAAATFTLR
jgi:ATP-dependent helicase/nuclease subunit A